MTHPSSRRVPTIFVPHGAPLLAVDHERGAPLRAWGEQLEGVKAVLAISAHWQATSLVIGSTEGFRLLYDFDGFPEQLYRVHYDAMGAPDLAKRVAQLMGIEPITSERAWDHGVWTPLIHLRPQADTPVLQISMPRSLGPRGLFALGQRLAPLRQEGILIMGSGNVVHNLRRLDWGGQGEPPAWAREFDDWTQDVLTKGELDRLIDFERTAPALRLAHPTDEHLLPLLVVAGAGMGDQAAFPMTGWEYGSLSRRGVQFG